MGFNALPHATTLLPGLTAFASFWFPNEEFVRSKTVDIDNERAIGAMVLTLIYVLITLTLFIVPLFLSYDAQELTESESFPGRLDSALAFVGVLSTLATIPLQCLTPTPKEQPEGG